jgi:flavoprotein
VDLFLSKAAAEVLSMYDIDVKSLRERFTCFRDSTASASPVGLFYDGRYKRLIIAPATSNTIAKMVWGIADTLVTNIYAQAGKCRIPSIVFACDTEPEMETEAPGGTVMVYPRQVDLDNVKRLEKFEYTTVVTSFTQLVTTLDEMD